MASHNKGYCFNCAEPVEAGAYETIGRLKLWVCEAGDCHRQLQEDMRGYEDEVRMDADAD